MIDEFFEEISDDEPTRAEQEMTDYWGEKCPDYDRLCPTCKAWKEFEASGEILKC